MHNGTRQPTLAMVVTATKKECPRGITPFAPFSQMIASLLDTRAAAGLLKRAEF
jgi:hypothetical protein